MSNDEERPIRQPAHEIGQDLSTLSIGEIEERIRLMEEEIGRLRAAAAKKSDSRAAADAFFRSG